jgi:hypothetical protein
VCMCVCVRVRVRARLIAIRVLVDNRWNLERARLAGYNRM